MTIYNVITTALMIILGAVSYYLKTKANVTQIAQSLVAIAEETYKTSEKAGKEKLNYVLNSLYENYIPTTLKPFFPKEMLIEIIEYALATAKEYALAQVEAIEAKAEETANEYIESHSK